MSRTVQLLSLMLTITFVAIAGFGVFAMPSHHHEPGCPFMQGEHTICPMNTAEHLSAWQNVFTSTQPTVSLLILSTVTLVLVSWRKNNLPRMFPIRLKLYSSDSPAVLPSLFQVLFSDGILNPKAP